MTMPMRQVTPLLKQQPKRKPATAAALRRKADKLWGQVIHTRDRACRFCGRTDGKLDAHHVMVRTFNATRCDSANGLLLCFRCHQDVAHGDPFAAVLEYERIFGPDGYRALREKAYAGCKANVGFWSERISELSAELDRLTR